MISRNSGADPLSAGDGRPVLMRQAGRECEKMEENVVYGCDIPAEYQSEVLRDILIKMKEQDDEADI